MVIAESTIFLVEGVFCRRNPLFLTSTLTSCSELVIFLKIRLLRRTFSHIRNYGSSDRLPRHDISQNFILTLINPCKDNVFTHTLLFVLCALRGFSFPFSPRIESICFFSNSINIPPPGSISITAINQGSNLSKKSLYNLPDGWYPLEEIW
jgi:hypothetical protein